MVVLPQPLPRKEGSFLPGSSVSSAWDVAILHVSRKREATTLLSSRPKRCFPLRNIAIVIGPIGDFGQTDSQ